MSRLLLPLAFLAVFASVAMLRAADQVTIADPKQFRRIAQPGAFPDQWINGTDCEANPDGQVHAYNEDLYIIRQSKCDSYEAPFLYLIFGKGAALLLDTGSFGFWPVAQIVKEVYDDWTERNGVGRIPLIVAHTHSHGDHIYGDFKFQGLPNVFVIPPTLESVIQFWGFEDYPNDQTQIDLGGRVLDVLGTPGHEPTSISVYDRRTQLLLTGDIVYPGHLFIFSPGHWTDFKASIERLWDFTKENPVEWVVGCHIEMAATPFESYKYTTVEQPNEHTLQFRPKILKKILEAAIGQGVAPSCEIFDEFVIHPVYECGITWNG